MPFDRKRVFVYNISKYATREMLEAYFAKFGEVSDIAINQNRYDRSLKYGFFSFATEKQADDCIRTINRERPFNMRADYAKVYAHRTNSFDEKEWETNFRNQSRAEEITGTTSSLKEELTSKFKDEDPHGKCVLCSKLAYFMCNCTTWYCSKKCQNLHWNIHAKDCIPMLQLPSLKMALSESCQQLDDRKNKLSDTKIESDPATTLHEDPSKVKVVHCTNPNSFYVQYLKDEKDIETINTMLNFICPQSEMFVPMEGDMCAANYMDNWYRAIVINFDYKKPKVLFIDSGNEQHIDLNNMIELPPELKHYPKMAHYCSLDEVFPLEDSWPQKDIEDFNRLVSAEEFTIYITKIERGKLVVELFDSEDNDLGDLLINLRIAQKMPSVTLGSEVEFKLPQLKLGDKVELKPTKTEKNFFCAQIYQDNESYDQFVEMEEGFNSAELKPISNIIAGDFVLAFSPSSKKWRRAKVLSVLSEVENVVFYVDYGNVEVVEKIAPLTKNWSIPSKLMCLTCTNKSKPTFAKNGLHAIITLVQNSCIQLILVDEDCSVLLKGQPMPGPIKSITMNI